MGLSLKSPGSICRALKEQDWPRHLKIWLIKAQGGLGSSITSPPDSQSKLTTASGLSQYLFSFSIYGCSFEFLFDVFEELYVSSLLGEQPAQE